jgi:hypothetical protein
MRRSLSILAVSSLLGLMSAGVALGQLSATDVEVLKARGRNEGWTFTVGPNPATERPLEELCGVKEPPNWQRDAPFAAFGTPGIDEANSLPASFDWRALGGCTPIRNQGSCGACWAFATVGALECAIKIMDGNEVDLSEQWLVSCNTDGWGCGGGWFAHDYHMWKTDVCGGTGAVLESSFPYVGSNVTCNCPYPHPYLLRSWGYVGSSGGLPAVDAIKQAIMTYGPVAVMVCADSAFQAYTGGVFNACSSGPINHAVALVGWDNAQGASGVWFLRNSWGTGWGEGGYMRIQYGCSSVGYGASFVDYAGTDVLQISPTDGFVSSGPVGGPFAPGSRTYTLTNTGPNTLDWSVTHTQPWLSTDPNSGTLEPNATAAVDVSITQDANSLSTGIYTDTVTFQNLTTGKSRTRSATLRVGQPDYFTEVFGTGENDLQHKTLVFTPDGSTSFYAACAETAGQFSVDPRGGTVLTLSDDSYVQVNILEGKQVSLYGQSYTSFFVGSNGYITFGSGDTSYDGAMDTHFGKPRISGLFKDLNPGRGGTVSWKQLSERIVVTWEAVAEWGSSSLNSFQIDMAFDGSIAITWLSAGDGSGLAGLSQGAGVPSGFIQSDLSTYGACGRPMAYDASVNTPLNGTVMVNLVGTDDGLPNPPGELSYVITSLPTHGTLQDPNGGAISTVPHTLASGGQHVIYEPAVNWEGSDSFEFKANDGGTPPNGGDSHVASVAVNVSGRMVFLTENFEGYFIDGAPPGWTKQFKTDNVDWIRSSGDLNGGGAHDGMLNALLFAEAFGDHETYLITPGLNLGSRVSDVVLEFWHKQAAWRPSQDTLTVLSKTSPAGSWTTLASYTTDTPTWTQRTIPLADTSGTLYIGFLGNATWAYGVCIDDMVVSGRPLYQLNLAVTNPTWGHVEMSPEPNDANAPLFQRNTLVTLTAVANEGKGFQQWTIYDPNHPGDANYATVDSNNPVTVFMDADKDVTATFTELRYALTLAVAPPATGWVQQDPLPEGDGKYAYGTAVTLTANPAGGYAFSSWSGGATGPNNPTQVTMDADKAVTANFAVGRTLTLLVSHDNWGTVIPEPNLPLYPQGATVTLTAVPNSGKSFRGWTIDDPNYPPEDPRYYNEVDPNTLEDPLVLPLTLDSDMQVEADFKCGSGLEQVLPLLAVGVGVFAFGVRRRR